MKRKPKKTYKWEATRWECEEGYVQRETSRRVFYAYAYDVYGSYIGERKTLAAAKKAVEKAR